jgi:cysteine synthase
MSILSAIGNTPLVELNALKKKEVEKMTCGTIVAILPDRGDRYLSKTLFRSICAKCPP